MTDKFANIPLDNDTKIISSLQVKFGELDCVYQTWSYDSIIGSSVIFASEDVQAYSEKELKDMLKETTLLEKKDSVITVSKRKESPFVFVNFNFKSS